jgi:hypothetical protein
MTRQTLNVNQGLEPSFSRTFVTWKERPSLSSSDYPQLDLA